MQHLIQIAIFILIGIFKKWQPNFILYLDHIPQCLDRVCLFFVTYKDWNPNQLFLNSNEYMLWKHHLLEKESMDRHPKYFHLTYIYTFLKVNVFQKMLFSQNHLRYLIKPKLSVFLSINLTCWQN